MKSINLHYEDKDFRRLKAAQLKSGLKWEDFVFQLAEQKKDKAIQ